MEGCEGENVSGWRAGLRGAAHQPVKGRGGAVGAIVAQRGVCVHGAEGGVVNDREGLAP